MGEMWQHDTKYWLILDWEFQGGKKRKLRQVEPNINWWRLQDQKLKRESKEKVIDEQDHLREYMNIRK